MACIASIGGGNELLLIGCNDIACDDVELDLLVSDGSIDPIHRSLFLLLVIIVLYLPCKTSSCDDNAS